MGAQSFHRRCPGLRRRVGALVRPEHRLQGLELLSRQRLPQPTPISASSSATSARNPVEARLARWMIKKCVGLTSTFRTSPLSLNSRAPSALGVSNSPKIAPRSCVSWSSPARVQCSSQSNRSQSVASSCRATPRRSAALPHSTPSASSSLTTERRRCRRQTERCAGTGTDQPLGASAVAQSRSSAPRSLSSGLTSSCKTKPRA